MGWPSSPNYQQYLPLIEDPAGVEPTGPPPGFNIARTPDAVLGVGPTNETFESDDEDDSFLNHSTLIAPPTAANNNASAQSMPALQSNSSSSTSTDAKPDLKQFRYRQRVLGSIAVSDDEELPVDEQEEEEEETIEEMRARVLRDLTDTPSPPPVDLIEPLEVSFSHSIFSFITFSNFLASILTCKFFNFFFLIENSKRDARGFYVLQYKISPRHQSSMANPAKTTGIWPSSTNNE